MRRSKRKIVRVIPAKVGIHRRESALDKTLSARVDIGSPSYTPFRTEH